MAANRCAAVTWTRRPKFSVIQRGTQYPVESHGQGQSSRQWTRKPKLSVIQRAKPVESHGQGHTPNSGCGRVFSSSVILAKRGSPRQGQSSTSSLPWQNHPGDSRAERENDVHNGDCVTGRIRGRGRVAASSVILAKRGSPRQGQGGTLSLPRWNQPGDSSVASLPLNDSK